MNAPDLLYRGANIARQALADVLPMVIVFALALIAWAWGLT